MAASPSSAPNACRHQDDEFASVHDFEFPALQHCGSADWDTWHAEHMLAQEDYFDSACQTTISNTGFGPGQYYVTEPTLMYRIHSRELLEEGKAPHYHWMQADSFSTPASTLLSPSSTASSTSTSRSRTSPSYLQQHTESGAHSATLPRVPSLDLSSNVRTDGLSTSDQRPNCKGLHQLSRAERRREQNRESQRRYRETRDARLKAAEDKVKDLEKQLACQTLHNQTLEQERSCLQAQLSHATFQLY